VDALRSTGAPTAIANAESWPAYRLSDPAPVVDAMLIAAWTHHNPRLTTVVCGPSNVGNYFAAKGVDAICGFGVTYQNLHAPNECLTLDTIEMTHRVYSAAIDRLLASRQHGG
jgi:acetylornithine deacetylase/succinyl-diaminopimelate desuccinylase-like protein